MYIDPGVGSILVQVVAGLLLTIPFIIKMYGKRIWGALKGVAKSKDRG